MPSWSRYIGAVLLVALLFGAGWLANSVVFGDFRTHDLGDGRKIVLLRNLDQAYPVYAKTVKAELDLALDQKKELLTTAAGGKYETSARELYDRLDAINADVRTAVISAYTGLALKVSSTKEPTILQEAFKKWDEALELVIKEAFKIRAINQQLAAVKRNTSSGEWERLFTLGRDAAQSAKALKTLVTPQR